MKGKDAKINRIFTAIGCLAVALALAAFSCFAWFASNNKAQNDLTATVSSGNITDLTVNYYSLTGKTESGGTTTYTVYKDLGEEDGANGVAIGAYGSTGSTATLIKVSYTVKDGAATQIIFAGSGTATFPATLVTKTVNEEEKDFYSTTMSSAVSLRLTDSNSYTITPKLDNNGDEYSDTPTTITTSKTAQTFCDVSGLSSSDEGEITETNIAFTNINGEQDSDGYYYVTQYIVMEYSEDNVFALYPSSGVNYSIPLSCSKDITLAVKDNSTSSDVDTSDSGSSDSGSSSSDSTSSDSTSSDSTSSDSTSSDSSGGSSGGETITVELSYDMSSYYSTDFATTVGTNATTIYFTSSSAYTTETTTAILAYTTTAGSNSTASSASSTYITTGGATNTSGDDVGRYFTIDLSEYEGYTVDISATMSSTGNNERYLILSTANSTTDYTAGLAHATSSSSSTQDTLNYGATVASGNSTLYLTCSGSVRVYSITITLTKTT